MTFTVALLILALGIAIGYRLPDPIARIKALYRRLTYKPAVLRRIEPDAAALPAQQQQAD